jgi:hypothetical protein
MISASVALLAVVGFMAAAFLAYRAAEDGVKSQYVALAIVILKEPVQAVRHRFARLGYLCVPSLFANQTFSENCRRPVSWLNNIGSVEFRMGNGRVLRSEAL